MGSVLFACSADNDGYPTCTGDGSTCGPDGSCPRVPPAGAEVEYHARSGSMTSSAYLGLASGTAARRIATDRYTGSPVVLDWRDGAWHEAGEE